MLHLTTKFKFLLTLILICVGNTMVGVNPGDVFTRISAVGDLADGDEIIFVNQAETYACGTTQNTNNRTPVSITTSNNSYTYASSENVQVFVVKKNSSGQFGFHTGSGYIYSASSSNNYLNTNTTSASTAPSGTSAWNLSVSNDVFTITNVTNTSYYIAFNSTNYFSQYKSDMIKPYIYKKETKPSIGTFSTIPAQSLVINNSIDFNPADYYEDANGVSGTTSLSVTPASGDIYYSDGKIYATALGSQTFTVTATPAAADEEDFSSASTTFTVTVHKPNHTVTFSINGNTENTSSVEEDQAITFPGNPANIYGKVFRGWATDDIIGTTNTAPKFVTSANMGTEDVIYYAVFANVIPGNSTSQTDVLTASTFGNLKASSYSNWTGKSATGGSEAVYAGNCTKDSGGNIQLRSSENSGIVSTTSGGRAKKVTISWDSSTKAGRTLDIYGKNTAYSSAADLYSSTSSTKGTKLGSIVKGTSTEFTITGNYSYIGLRSNDNAMYIASISIDWGNGTPDTYSDYCTTVSGDIDLSISKYEFSTLYYGDRSFVVPASVKAYTFKVDNANQLVVSKVYNSGETIPAGEAVVVNGAEGNYTFVVSDASGTEDDDNVLRGLDAAGTTTGGTIYYKLSLNAAGDENSIGFYWGAASGAAFTSAAHKAYVAVDAELTFNGIATKERGISLHDILGESSAVDDILECTNHKEHSTDIFDLQGRKVSKPIHGLFIVNGKKLFLR